MSANYLINQLSVELTVRQLYTHPVIISEFGGIAGDHYMPYPDFVYPVLGWQLGPRFYSVLLGGESNSTRSQWLRL
jgi:hypothetical protein